MFGVNTYTDNTGNPKDSQWVYTGKIGKSNKSESAIISQFEEDKEKFLFRTLQGKFIPTALESINITFKIEGHECSSFVYVDYFTDSFQRGIRNGISYRSYESRCI